MENLERVLNNIGTDIVKKYKLELTRLDKISSGKLFNSIDYKLVITSDSYKLYFIAEDYFINVEKGRASGKMPPINAIKKWMQFKGIVDRSAYIIARSISKKGIRPNSSLKEARSVEDYSRLIEDALKLDYKQIIKMK